MSRNFSCQAKPANYFVNFGVFLIQPSKKVFDHVMRAWHTGNHTYFPLFAEQSLMMDLVYKHRLFDMYPLNDCDNNKADGDPTCRRKLRVMWHRMPRREARRTRMLYEAAVAGRCHANRKLLDFSYKDD